MSKRRKFLVSAAAVAGFFWLLQYVPLDYRALMVGGLALFTYGAAALSLREDLRGVEWLTLLILPVMYSLAAGFFYYLLPNHFLSRLVVSLVFLVGLYAILLTENIYSVAAVRTIQLVRAAHAVGFLMTVLTTVLLFNVLYSFH